jgi:integrase
MKTKTGGKPAQCADGGGLFVLVKRMADGKDAKFWRMRYTLNGKRNMLGFGQYPEISLARARAWRDEMRELLRQGIDPVKRDKEAKAAEVAQEVQEARDAGNTLEQVTRRMLESKKGKVGEAHRARMAQTLEKYVFKTLGAKNINEVTGAEIMKLCQGVAEETNNSGNKKTYTAGRIAEYLEQVFDFGMVEESYKRGGNPALRLKKFLPKHEEQNMPRIAFEELPAFVKALRRYGGHERTRAAMWMLLYTGMRTASVRRATWGDFDLDGALWERKPEKGDKNVLTLPLPRQAVAILRNLNAMAKDEGRDGEGWHVFYSVSLHSNEGMSDGTITHAIKRMKFDMTGHGLRGLVSTALNELGFSERLVEMQLGHKLQGVEGAYNKSERLGDRRVMMQRWADFLDALLDGKTIEEAKKETAKTAEEQ